MEYGSTLAVSLLLFSPLTAAVLVLAGRFPIPRLLPVFAFVLWFFGSAAGIYAALHLHKSGAATVYSMGGWAAPFGISPEVAPLVPAVTIIYLLVGSAVWFQSRRAPDLGPLFSFFFISHFLPSTEFC